MADTTRPHPNRDEALYVIGQEVYPRGNAYETYLPQLNAAIDRYEALPVDGLRDEFIICHAAGYPDPLDVYPPTIENARESARLLKPDPEYGRVVIRHRVVSEWKEVRR